MSLNEILGEAKAMLDDTIQLRRRIHRHPELGLSLPRTQATVLEALDGLGLEVRTGQRTTSVVARLRGARPGPTILLRGDMDALPMPEDTGLPFASREPGRNPTHISAIGNSSMAGTARQAPSISASSWSTMIASTAAATQPNSTEIQFCVCRPVKM